MDKPYPKKKIVLICRTVVFYGLRAMGKAPGKSVHQGILTLFAMLISMQDDTWQPAL